MELDDFTMIGAGSLGSVLCRSLTHIGLRMTDVVVRNTGSGEALVQENESGRVVKMKEWSGPRSVLTFLAVPDDALIPVAEELAARGEWSGRTVLHCSGVYTRDALQAFALRGAAVGSFHPLQTFTGTEDHTAFRGITVGIEGDPHAVLTAKHVADGLLAEAIELRSEDKALYHAAAVMAGNAAITLLSVSEEMWEHAAGTRDGFAASMGPLIRRSIENALSTSPEQALTGPIARGDTGTLNAHFAAIAARLPHLMPLYASVATETVHLAMRSGRLTPDKAVALLDLISEHVLGEPSSD